MAIAEPTEISRPRPVASRRRLGAARVLWGAALLLAPRRVIGDLPHNRIDRPARVVARVLGARHLIEAAFTGRRTRRLILIGVGVDAIHAVTFLGLAQLRPDRQRLALTNVVTAAAFAVAGTAECRSARPNHAGRS